MCNTMVRLKRLREVAVEQAGAALRNCKLRNTEKVSRFTATSLLTLIEMVDADLGITFLPEMAAKSAMLRKTHVKTFPLSERSYRTIALAWRKGSNRADEFRMFGNFLQEQCGEHFCSNRNS